MIIIVSSKTNKLFSPLADIQTWDSSRGSNLPTLESQNQIKNSYYFAKYGEFEAKPGFGYIRHMLNLHTGNIRLSDGKANLGPMTATYITGADERLKNAYASLLDSNLLEGIVVADSLPLNKPVDSNSAMLP